MIEYSPLLVSRDVGFPPGIGDIPPRVLFRSGTLGVQGRQHVCHQGRPCNASLSLSKKKRGMADSGWVTKAHWKRGWLVCGGDSQTGIAQGKLLPEGL